MEVSFFLCLQQKIVSNRQIVWNVKIYKILIFSNNINLYSLLTLRHLTNKNTAITYADTIKYPMPNFR